MEHAIKVGVNANWHDVRADEMKLIAWPKDIGRRSSQSSGVFFDRYRANFPVRVMRVRVRDFPRGNPRGALHLTHGRDPFLGSCSHWELGSVSGLWRRRDYGGSVPCFSMAKSARERNPSVRSAALHPRAIFLSDFAEH
jgi:hypothetical protein